MGFAYRDEVDALVERLDGQGVDVDPGSWRLLGRELPVRVANVVSLRPADLVGYQVEPRSEPRRVLEPTHDAVGTFQVVGRRHPRQALERNGANQEGAEANGAVVHVVSVRRADDDRVRDVIPSVLATR